MSNSKKWFLVKKEWTENDMLSDEQFGMLIRALYCSSMPEDDLVKGMYIAYMQEYARVNNYMLEDAQARSEKAKKAANTRWNNAKPMLKHANSMLEDANIDIDIDINKGKGIDMYKDKDIVNLPDDKLTYKEKVEKAKIIFQ